MSTCPECSGKGFTSGFGCPGFKPIALPCTLCKGEKVISEEQMRWVSHGEKLRAERIAAHITLREAAKRRGIPASELSSLEFGRFNNLHIKSL